MPNGTIGRTVNLGQGSLRFDPLEVESEQIRTWTERIAQEAIREQDITWRTIYKKNAMSPVIFMTHAWAVGNWRFDGDIWDFINFVRFTCDKGRGALPAMVTGRPSLQTVVNRRARC
jgi:hypothetical protein